MGNNIQGSDTPPPSQDSKGGNDKTPTDESGTTCTKLDTIPRGQLALNFLIAQFWIGPLVVIFWFGTWMLSSTILFVPEKPELSAWISAAIGYGIFFIASCAQNKIRDFATKRNKVLKYLISRLYTWVMGVAVVNQWRSSWDLWEIYTGVSPTKGAIYGASCYLIMALLRCCRQTIAPPVIVVIDFPLNSYFEMATYRKIKVGSAKHMLDSLFTVVVVGTLVVGVWRGLWEVYDTALYPGDMKTSGFYCLLISYGLAAFLLMFTVPFQKLSAWAYRKHWLLQRVIEDIVMMGYAVCSITHWRAYWLLYDVYILTPPLRYWVAHAGAFLLLASILASNSLLVTGCLFDAEDPNGESLSLDFHYFTNIISGYKRRKAYKLSKPERQVQKERYAYTNDGAEGDVRDSPNTTTTTTTDHNGRDGIWNTTNGNEDAVHTTTTTTTPITTTNGATTSTTNGTTTNGIAKY